MAGSHRSGQGRRSRRMMTEINVVPYIDVMLVLLIIFMVTAPMVTPTVIDLPRVGAANQMPAKPLEVIVQKDGSLQVQDREAGDRTPRPMSKIELVSLARALQQAQSVQPVVISADRQTPYEQVLAVMDELNRNHVKRVGLAVKPAT